MDRSFPILHQRASWVAAVAMTVTVIAIIDPDILWEVGFQLTLLVTLRLVLYTGPLMDAFVKLAERFISNERVRTLFASVGEYFPFTLVALALTLPVMVHYFRRLPLASLLTNPLV